MIQKYKINWGSYKHILAIVELLKLAVNDNCEYFSVISANTVLVRHPKEVIDFFVENKDDIFMEIVSKDSLSEKNRFWAFDYRYSAFFFQHLYNVRSANKVYRKFVNINTEQMIAKFQQKLHLRNNVSFAYKGYVYCHFPRIAAKYVLNYLEENKNYIRELKYCFVGEEFFFQNIFMRMEFSGKVNNTSLIYDVWSEERGYPANLNIEDLKEIEKDKFMFARKVASINREVFDEIRKVEKF